MSVQTSLWSSNVNGRQVQRLHGEAGNMQRLYRFNDEKRGSVYQSACLPVAIRFDVDGAPDTFLGLHTRSSPAASRWNSCGAAGQVGGG